MIKTTLYFLGAGLAAYAINHYQRLRKDMTLAGIQEKKRQKRKVYLIALAGLIIVGIATVI